MVQSTGPPSDLHTPVLEFSFHSVIKRATLVSLSCARTHNQSTQSVLSGSGGTQPNLHPPELPGDALLHMPYPLLCTTITYPAPHLPLLRQKGPFTLPSLTTDAELCSKPTITPHRCPAPRTRQGRAPLCGDPLMLSELDCMSTVALRRLLK